MNHLNSSHALVLTTWVWELLPFNGQILARIESISQINY